VKNLRSLGIGRAKASAVPPHKHKAKRRTNKPRRPEKEAEMVKRHGDESKKARARRLAVRQLLKRLDAPITPVPIAVVAAPRPTHEPAGDTNTSLKQPGPPKHMSFPDPAKVAECRHCKEEKRGGFDYYRFLEKRYFLADGKSRDEVWCCSWCGSPAWQDADGYWHHVYDASHCADVLENIKARIAKEYRAALKRLVASTVKRQLRSPSSSATPPESVVVDSDDETSNTTFSEPCPEYDAPSPPPRAESEPYIFPDPEEEAPEPDASPSGRKYLKFPKAPSPPGAPLDPPPAPPAAPAQLPAPAPPLPPGGGVPPGIAPAPPVPVGGVAGRMIDGDWPSPCAIMKYARSRFPGAYRAGFKAFTCVGERLVSCEQVEPVPGRLVVLRTKVKFFSTGYPRLDGFMAKVFGVARSWHGPINPWLPLTALTSLVAGGAIWACKQVPRAKACAPLFSPHIVSVASTTYPNKVTGEVVEQSAGHKVMMCPQVPIPQEVALEMKIGNEAMTLCATQTNPLNAQLADHRCCTSHRCVSASDMFQLIHGTPHKGKCTPLALTRVFSARHAQSPVAASVETWLFVLSVSSALAAATFAVSYGVLSRGIVPYLSTATIRRICGVVSRNVYWAMCSLLAPLFWRSSSCSVGSGASSTFAD